MGLIAEEDQKRFFNQIALEGVEHYTHPSTGLIQDDGVVIVYDNFLAALALLQSKLKENIEKAKKLLERLLNFQNPQGFFPVALHQFPDASSEEGQLEIAFVLLKISTKYGPVLGSECFSKVQSSLASLIEQLKSLEPFSLEKMQARFSVLEALSKNLKPTFSFPQKEISSKYLGEKLLLAQETPDGPQWLAKLAQFWHPHLQIYVGPLLQEHYVQSSPKLTIFDYMMSSYYRSYPQRLHEKTLLQLQGAIVKFFEERGHFQPNITEGSYRGNLYTICNTDTASWFFFKDYTFLENKNPGLHLLRCMFKSLDCLYHLVCHSDVKKMTAHLCANTLEIEFTYFDDFPEDVKKQNELEFFISRQENLEVFVDGKKASLFRLGSRIEFKTPEATVSCVFTTDSAQAQIVGHLFYGNRPSSLDPDHGPAHDQMMVLRTLRRDSKCKVKLLMHYEATTKS